MTKSIPGLNNEIQFGEEKFYCTILGESPSKGARSPDLWNGCFKHFNIPSVFYPFDVSAEDLGSMVEYLKSDHKFMGGAVTVPHKESIISHLDKVEEEASYIGAVNLIYKKNGALIGSNTDGLGAILSMSRKYNASFDSFAKGMNALIIGTGGAAKACAIYLAKALGHEGNMYISARSLEKAQSLASACSVFTKAQSLSLNELETIISEIDLLVNCTTVGFRNPVKDGKTYFLLEPFTPLGPLPKKGFINTEKDTVGDWLVGQIPAILDNIKKSYELIGLLKKNSFVMDVIYQPEETSMIKIANCYQLPTLSGKSMNLLQAVYGFVKVFSEYESKLEEVERIMGEVQ